MPTERPRIQAYVEPAIHDSFLKWKQERGISKDSEALNQLLAEYLGFVPQSPIPNSRSSMTEEIQEYIEERCEEWATRIKAALAEKLPSRSEIGERVTQEINSRIEQESEFWYNKLCERLYTFEQRLNALRDGVKEQLNQLSNRLETVENVVKPIEELAEISHAFPESPSESLLPVEDTEEELAKDSLADQPLPGELPGELGNNALARRLGVNGSTVLKNRDKPSFEEWSKAKDPDAIAWRYDRLKQKFTPVT